MAEEIIHPTKERAEEVRQALLRIKNNVEDCFFDTCELLLEAKEGSYHRFYGYQIFGDWVEEASGLDMRRRQADYLVAIARKSRELGLSREQLKAARISLLKEIFSLDVEEHGEDIKKLIGEASEGASLQTIRDKVQAIKARDGEEPWVYVTLKMRKSEKLETWDKACELARRNYGDKFNKEEGHEHEDISDGACAVLLALSFLQDSNNYPEGIPIEGESKTGDYRDITV